MLPVAHGPEGDGGVQVGLRVGGEAFVSSLFEKRDAFPQGTAAKGFQEDLVMVRKHGDDSA